MQAEGRRSEEENKERRRGKKSSNVNEQLAGLPRQTASIKQKSSSSFFVVTFFVFFNFPLILSELPSFAQKNVSFLLTQFPEA